MSGIPNSGVRKLRSLLKDFPVSVRVTSTCRFWNALITVRRLDKQPFGPEMAARLNDVVEDMDACEFSEYRTLRADRIKP